MALYTSESRDRVREAVDFAELVSTRTELRRAGPGRLEGLCPFHEERTPSFGIDPLKKVYHCFGCGASGDVFTFVEETEGLDFKGALELLAERYHVELELEAEERGDAERRRRRERLQALLARTADFYARYLWEAAEAAPARDYLAGRGLAEQTLREFGVGFAPDAWDRLLTASRAGGYGERELLDAGLAQRARGSDRIYDRFRGRITFPLADARGRVLGFGARALGDEQPKYLNSPDGEIYHKGKNLYGAHLARQAAARAGRVVLCEGYTDVVALHQAGIGEAVGLMGTALTPDQLSELGRMAPVVVLALDADGAGREAMLKAADRAPDHVELRVAALPAGTDPAELVANGGPQAAVAALADSLPVVRFRVERALAAGDATTPEGRDRTLAELRPIFAEQPQGAMRLELVRTVAVALDLPESLAAELLAGPRRAHAGTGRAAVQPTASGEATERAFLALAIASGDAGRETLAALDVDELFAGELTRQAAAALRERGAGAQGEAEGELAALFSELYVQAAGEEHEPALLELQLCQLELAALDRSIRRARATGGQQVSDLARRRDELKRRFDSAYAEALEGTVSH